MDICFADQRLTVLTEEFRRFDDDVSRLEILEEALPLCADIPDVRMFYTGTFPGDVVRRPIEKRWDQMMMSRIKDIRVWTQEKCHRLYLMCRSGSLPEATVLTFWEQVNGKRA